MALISELTTLSLPRIAQYFGKKDHTTVLHAVRKINDICRTDATKALEIAELQKSIVAGLKTHDHASDLQPMAVTGWRRPIASRGAQRKAAGNVLSRQKNTPTPKRPSFKQPAPAPETALHS